MTYLLVDPTNEMVFPFWVAFLRSPVDMYLKEVWINNKAGWNMVFFYEWHGFVQVQKLCLSFCPFGNLGLTCCWHFFNKTFYNPQWRVKTYLSSVEDFTPLKSFMLQFQLPLRFLIGFPLVFFGRCLCRFIASSSKVQR